MGLISLKEYVELEWLIDIFLVLVWVVYIINFFGILVICKVLYIYVVNWFLGVFMLIVVIFYIGNSMVILVFFIKLYLLYVGVVDVMM